MANQRLQTPPGNAFVSAVRVDGGMAERLHLEQAQRMLGLTSR